MGSRLLGEGASSPASSPVPLLFEELHMRAEDRAARILASEPVDDEAAWRQVIVHQLSELNAKLDKLLQGPPRRRRVRQAASRKRA